MECPRCASNSNNDERFCWMCGWDFNKAFDICEQCGFEVQEDEVCVICETTLGRMFSEDEDVA